MTNPVFQPPADPPPALPREQQPPAPGPDPKNDPPASPPSNEDRKGGDRAILADLAKERDKRQQLEERLAKLSPLEQLAELMGKGKEPPTGKSEYEALREKFETYETELQTERQARWRAEVAAAKGLTADQAAWISGATAEEFAASADKLLASFPTTPAGPRTPAPDPSQGARGAGTPDLDAQIAAAQTAGDWQTVIGLKRQKTFTT